MNLNQLDNATAPRCVDQQQACSEEDDVCVWFAGEPLSAQKVLEGLCPQFSAIRHLWPRWGNYTESDEGPRVGEAETAKMNNDPYPRPIHVHGYCMYPPDRYTDQQKWKWLTKLLQLCGELPQNDLAMPALGHDQSKPENTKPI